jgi:hypothetical protein
MLGNPLLTIYLRVRLLVIRPVIDIYSEDIGFCFISKQKQRGPVSKSKSLAFGATGEEASDQCRLLISAFRRNIAR